ncbi:MULTISPECIES: dihydroneopterin aldolase [unclassified Legionella]|uniref:dihydroneopterin aldolase n=1 Tax=unclassified Legionella TaxID=2622702 RepID=UPI001055FD2D|nr:MULTISPECIES: dihydroneopterin aldolase [unclassified Legionella]MDI9817935.1 dihydroneopterin aldolase [Legionella sp. PL877]
MDTLQITGLSIQTHIGVHAWEQKILQPLLIDITIPGDFSACQDDIANTIDYDKLCQQVTAYVEVNSFRLIETVAEQLAQLIKSAFNVQQITISVSKPHAIKNAANIRVTITR